jgi:hypothetical protein
MAFVDGCSGKSQVHVLFQLPEHFFSLCNKEFTGTSTGILITKKNCTIIHVPEKEVP